jgi:hypothetical protein
MPLAWFVNLLLNMKLQFNVPVLKNLLHVKRIIQYPLLEVNIAILPGSGECAGKYFTYKLKKKFFF